MRSEVKSKGERIGPGGHPNSPTCGHPKFLRLTEA
jgi:hypothetical protein